MHQLWLEEALRAIAWMAAGGITGALTGFIVLGLWLGTLGYGLQNAARLRELLGHLAADDSDLPESTGPWAEAYNLLHRLRVRFKKRRKKLRKALVRFRQSAAALPQGVVLLNQEYEIVWFNPAARQLLGLRDAPDTGHRITNIVRHPDFIAWLTDGGRRETLELPAPAQPELRLEAQLAPYGRNEWLLVVRDVTRLHALEAQRRDFVANASHELRTPLTVISGYLESLAGLGDEQHRPIYATMQQQAARMQSIIGDLLLLTRLETQTLPETLEALDVAALIRETLRELVPPGGSRHDIRMSLTPGLLLKAHEPDLRSVISNLVSNAQRYTPEGGSIEINWALREDGGAAFGVRDSGIGIPAHHLPRLTERFYRVDSGRSRASGGTGLGLAIVKHALHRHQAVLHIESEPGQGSLFEARFPPERVQH